VGDMVTRELKNALAAKSVFQRFFTYGAFSADERPVPAAPSLVEIEHTAHPSR